MIRRRPALQSTHYAQSLNVIKREDCVSTNVHVYCVKVYVSDKSNVTARLVPLLLSYMDHTLWLTSASFKYLVQIIQVRQLDNKLLIGQATRSHKLCWLDAREQDMLHLPEISFMVLVVLGPFFLQRRFQGRLGAIQDSQFPCYMVNTIAFTLPVNLYIQWLLVSNLYYHHHLLYTNLGS